MAFSLYIDEVCLSTSCTYVEYNGELQWIDSNGPNSEIVTVYWNNDSSDFTYSGPDDLYLTTSYSPGSGGSGGGTGSGGTNTDNQELTVRFKYYLDDIEIDTSNGIYISWPECNVDELKCYWFKYDGYIENDRESAVSGCTDRINFTYIPEYYGDPANSTPISNLKNSLELEAPMYTHLASPTFISGVNIHNTNDIYTYANCPTNILDIDVYFTSYEFNAYVYSNLPEYGDAYIGSKGIKQASFYASSVRPTTLRFGAEVLNNAFEFNRWLSYNTKTELSTENPYIIYHPQGRDYHVEAEFTGKKIRVALNPLNGKSDLGWQYVGIVAGTNTFQRLSFNASENIKLPDDKNRLEYEFVGWYTNVVYDGFGGKGSGHLIIDTNGNLQPNVPGWTTSDGLWIKGPDAVSPDLTTDVDVVVYAKWEPIEYNISYKNLKGAVNPPENPSKYTYESPTITFVKPTENLPIGYTWKCWSPKSIRYCSVHAKTITACWETNKYTLTWDLNGGTVIESGTCAPLDSTGVVSGQVEYLSSITAPVVLKNGYNFLGWSVNGVDVITPITTMPIGDVKYIAVYSKKTYQITVNDDPALDKVYIKVNGENKGTTTTCTTEDEITLIAENTFEYVLDYWKKSGGSIVSGLNEFSFTANDTLLDNTINNIFTAYYKDDTNATLKINFIVDDVIEKTAIFKFNLTFNFLGKSGTEEYMCEIQGEPKCLEGNIDINQQGFFFIPNKYNGKDICNVAGTEMICSNKGNIIGYDGYNSQYYKDNTIQNKYCPIGFEWQAYLPTNTVDETHLVFPASEKEEYGILYGPLVIDVYYGETPERFLPVISDGIEISQVSGLTLLQRIQNKISTFKWLNNLFGEPEKTSWDTYDNSGIKSFLKDGSKETPLSMHCIEYDDLAVGIENINLDKTIKQYSLTLDNIIKPLNGQVVLDISKIEGNKIYFNISNSTGFTNTSNGIYIYFSVNNETNENNATLYKMKLPKTASSKDLLLTIPGVSNIESLYIYRAPIMVDSTKVGIMPKIYFNYDNGIDVYDRTTLNVVI